MPNSFLVVDSSKDFFSELEISLRRINGECTHIKDFLSAYELVKTRKFATIVCQLELFRELRADELLKAKQITTDIPIFIIYEKLDLKSFRRLYNSNIRVFLNRKNAYYQIESAVNAWRNNLVLLSDEITNLIISDKKVGEKIKIQLIKAMNITKEDAMLMKHVCEEKTNIEIGSKLFKSERTIESQISVLFKKLGVKSRCGIGFFYGNHHEIIEHLLF